jgi:hypothetical protein
MFPLKDENPVRTKPILTVSLIVLNISIFGCALVFSSPIIIVVFWGWPRLMGRQKPRSDVDESKIQNEQHINNPSTM